MNVATRSRIMKEQNYCIHKERREIKENNGRHHTTITNETNQK
jgi:hypothetical protein